MRQYITIDTILMFRSYSIYFYIYSRDCVRNVQFECAEYIEVGLYDRRLTIYLGELSLRYNIRLNLSIDTIIL